MVKTVKKSLTDDGIFIFSWWPFDKISPVVTHFNEKFSMDIPESVIQEYTDKDCVYLLNRKTVAHTIDEINKIENLDWIESFFSVECLKNIIGNFTLPTLDFFTYHKIGYIFKNDIID